MDVVGLSNLMVDFYKNLSLIWRTNMSVEAALIGVWVQSVRAINH